MLHVFSMSPHLRKAGRDEPRQAEVRRLRITVVGTTRLTLVPEAGDSVAVSSRSPQGLQSVVSVPKPSLYAL